VVASVHEAWGEGGPLKTRRLSAAAHPVPGSKPAELECLPGVDSIVVRCREMVADA
jgi:hypothetical protein